MTRRALIAVALTAVAGGATFALAQDPAPEAPQTWRTRPEVPGVATTLVPFGVEATADGARAWALGQAGGKTVVLRRAPGGGWTADRLPGGGPPVGSPPVGVGAPQHAGETAPDGRAAVLLSDADPAADATLLTRDPGGAFVAAPVPGAALQGGERLVPDATRPTARALLAVLGGDDPDAGTLIAPTDGDGTGTAVLRLGADGWTREPIDAPDVTTGPLRPVGLAAASGKQAWLLARSGDDLVLLQRRPVPAPGGGTGTTTAPTPPPGTDTTTAPTPPPGTDTTTAPTPPPGTDTDTTPTPPPNPADPADPDDPTGTGTTTAPTPAPDPDPDDPTDPPAGERRMHWVPADVAPHPLLGGEGRPDGVSAVTVSAPPADPLTATTDGLWIDLGVTAAGRRSDATLHLRVEPGAGGASAPDEVAVDGSWCDVPAARCDRRLGLELPRGERGYRSLAFPAGPDAPFGGRIVSSPVDTGVPDEAPRRDAQRQGGYAQLTGERFALRDGIGEDGTSTTQAIAFSADGRGFTGGTMAVGVAAPETSAEEDRERRPGLHTQPVVTAAPSPDGDGTLLAFTRSGESALHEPGKGWRSPNRRVDDLRSTRDNSDPLSDELPPVRAVVWPRADLLIAIGSGGILTTGHIDPRTQSRLADGPGAAVHAERLPREATPLDIACTRDGDLECVTGGRAGLLLRGDAEVWATDRLPGAAADAEITGVAYDGRVAVVATSAGLFRHAGDGQWVRDEDLGARMAAAGQEPGVDVVATEPGGGTVVDGLWVRDAPTAPWRPTSAPLETHPVAIAAVRDPDGRVRTLVTGTPARTPLPTPFPPSPVPAPGSDDGGSGAPGGGGEAGGDEPGDEDPDAGSGESENSADDEESTPVPTDPSPVDPVTLRETADGWVDVDRASYQPSGGRDLPATTVGTRVLAVDAAGTGWALGGVAGDEPDEDPRKRVVMTTTSFERLVRGLPAPAPPEEGEEQPASGPDAEVPVAAGIVRLAIGGHPACLDRCTGGARQGVTPDVHLEQAVRRVSEMRRSGAGPAALVVGGGRASVGGEPLDEAGARRYRELLAGDGTPTFALPGPGDLQGGGPQAFSAAFATAAAPVGTGAPQDGITVDPALAPPPGPGGAPTRFTFDVSASAGRVRVLAIDNAAGRLEGGPDGPQAAWIRRVLDDARAGAVPVVAVGSASLVQGTVAALADDAAFEVALLAGRASAYVATAGSDDPEPRRFGGETARTVVRDPGSGEELPVLQSSTLGYGVTFAAYFGEDGELSGPDYLRQRAAALLTLDVDVSLRDPTTNVAPVEPRTEPLLGPVLFGAEERVTLGSATPIGANATDPAQHRHLVPAPGDRPRVATALRMGFLPSNSCGMWTEDCDTNVRDATRFSSSDESVGRFVAVARFEEAGPTIVTDDAGRPVDNPQLGVFCPVGLGTTTVTLRTMGREVRHTITVVPLDTPGLPDSEPDAKPPPRGTCGFGTRYGTPPTVPSPDGDAAPVEPQAPGVPSGPSSPGLVKTPLLPAPGAPVVASPPAPAPTPAPSTPPTVTPPPALAPVVPGPAADPTAPPVSPAAKAPSPPAPPPPTGHAQVPQTGSAPQAQGQVQTQVQGQLQPAVRAAEQDRREEAFEGDHAAAAYGRPASPLPWEIGGAVAVLLLVAGGGVAAGRLRRGAAPAYERHRR
ncbi:hypothetical protein [Patulibacter americanus]|uniref:hypothetical protein n=1 Tax=Patulibacter americanus TaxID=588672 RepID=UPI0003B3F626|nr:hypothetical protein [Patulibacter americanus]